MGTIARLAQRAWVSQYTPAAVLMLAVQSGGGPSDADGNLVTATMVPLSDSGVEGSPVFTDRAASREDTGVYVLTLGSADTAETGLYQVTWSYDLAAAAQTYVAYLEVGEPAPTYDGLPTEFKEIVETIWWHFQDLYDSPLGGPHLQTYMQSHFGRERVAQILVSSIGRMNVVSQPVMTYGLGMEVDGRKPFPVASYGSLLERRGVMEVIKHLIRSYTEQPNIIGLPTVRADRRDYVDRWRNVLRDEEREYEDILDSFKMAHMGLGQVNVAVAGGLYPRIRPHFTNRGLLAARGMFRVFYP